MSIIDNLVGKNVRNSSSSSRARSVRYGSAMALLHVSKRSCQQNEEREKTTTRVQLINEDEDP